MKNVVLASLAGLAVASAASAQLSIVSNIGGAFVDISGTATNLVAGSQGDDTNSGLSIPVGFGNAVLPDGGMFVTSNGRLLAAPGSGAFSNAAIGATSAIGYYPYWDDLRTDSNLTGLPASGIYAAVVGDAFIVQWQQATFFSGTGVQTFQIQIFNAAGQLAHGGALAQYIYPATPGAVGFDGASATIGVVGSATDFFQQSLNTAGSVVPGQTIYSIVQVPAPGAAAILGLGGLIAGRRRR